MRFVHNDQVEEVPRRLGAVVVGRADRVRKCNHNVRLTKRVPVDRPTLHLDDAR
jgi:hypothetical protein